MLEFTMMDALTASGSRQSFRDAGGQGTIVFDPARLGQATPATFDPSTYGARAQPVQGRGGRGSAWFVQGEFGDGVLRLYRRGGWVARASKDAYWWRGEQRVRSLREFALMQQLQQMGLPAPAPVAAFYRRAGLHYRAAIIVMRIEPAVSFASLVAASPTSAPWAGVGDAIGRCHCKLARHADLNANNVLLDRDGKAWLIDWDKGTLETRPGPWRDRVMGRLARSLRKECPALSPAELESGMARLRAAHDKALVG